MYLLKQIQPSCNPRPRSSLSANECGAVERHASASHSFLIVIGFRPQDLILEALRSGDADAGEASLVLSGLLYPSTLSTCNGASSN